MNPGAASLRKLRSIPLVTLFGCAGFILTGCGGSVGTGTGSSGNTSVTVLSTSTANDQLTEFNMYVKSLALNRATGSSATLISTPLEVEFMSVNGRSEPLLTVDVPQGTYTSASASIGSAEFECVTLAPSGGLYTSSYAYGYTPDSNVTVNLPAPLTISSASMVLSLDLLVSKSASWTTCDPNGSILPFSITPTFDLTAMTLSSSRSNSQNGLETGLKGVIGSVDSTGAGFTVTADSGPGCAGTAAGANCSPPAAYAPVWRVASDGGTVFEGVAGISKLTSGMGVDMDAALQPDGSLLAKRIAVYDSSTHDLTIAEGRLIFNTPIVGYQSLEMARIRELGPLNTAPITFSYGNAAFQISGEFKNLGDLPFPPNFTAANAVDGQNFYASTHALYASIPPTFVPATAITLIPQTINGTVSAIGSEGGFTTYTVTLAPYDLFPALAVQPHQTAVLTNPNTVVVYADSNTQMLNTNPIAVGSVARFYGLVFNDQGTLRMDCAQVSDGVAE